MSGFDGLVLRPCRSDPLTFRQYTVIITVIMDSDRYTIEQLQELTGYSRRAIRYYIQENLLDPPAGRGRGGFYSDSHLAHLRRIRSLQSQGMSLMAIKELLRSGEAVETPHTREVWARYDIGPGIELSVRRDVEAASGRKLSEIVRFATSVIKEETQDDQE